MEPLTPWARCELALAVLAIDPAGVKGLWLRARAGEVRDRVGQAFRSLPLPQRRLHPGVDDAALYGGIDLAATLAGGCVVRSAGVLDQPCAVVLTMAERCPAGLAARLARVLDDQGFSVIALDEGVEDEALPSALADRLGLFLDLNGLGWSDTGAIDLDPERLAAARAIVVAVPPDAGAQMVRVAAAMGIASMRAPLLALASARALAAWDGRGLVTEDDLQRAAELVLAHRGDVPDAAEPEQDAPPPDPGEAEASEREVDRMPDDILLEAVRAALPADLLARLQAGRAAKGARGSGSGAVTKGNRRGRPLPSRPGKPGSGLRIDLVATLRAAAPWQGMRGRGALGMGAQGLAIRAGDLRIKRYAETSDRLLIFAVDASGSSAMARLAETKGAVELLLAQAYARRDHVALVAFRGQGAELMLPPTRSLVQTKRRLAGLPGGGGTPLAAGLKLAFEVAGQARARGMTPTVALLTDGRGNIALDGSADRVQAEADALRLARVMRGTPAVVIDTGNRPQPSLRALAGLLDAPYIPLPRADAQRLSAVLSAALEA
ncbi:MAG: magnesium chelatase subunit D [Paracoccaceae bacterium]